MMKIKVLTDYYEEYDIKNGDIYNVKEDDKYYFYINKYNKTYAILKDKCTIISDEEKVVTESVFKNDFIEVTSCLVNANGVDEKRVVIKSKYPAHLNVNHIVSIQQTDTGLDDGIKYYNVLLSTGLTKTIQSDKLDKYL